MIYEWNELCYNDFKIFLEELLTRKSAWTKNKIMEIQDPVSIKAGYPLKRFFFGTYFNIFDYPEANKEFVSYLNSVSKILPDIKEEIQSNSSASMCELENGIPHISPIYCKELGVIWSTCFGDEDKKTNLIKSLVSKPIILWYIKDNGKIKIDLRPDSGKLYTGQERMIRFRTMDYDPDWKKLIGSEIEEKFTKDDIKEENITVIE